MLRFAIRPAGKPEQTIDVGVSPAFAGTEPGVPIPLSDPSAAPRQFSVEVRDVGVVLRDLASPAGTRVNGSLVSQIVLQAGDEIRVGDETVVFLLQTAVPAPRPPRPVPAAAPPPAPAPAAARPVPTVARAPRAARRRSGVLVPVVVFGLLAIGGVAAFYLVTEMTRGPGASSGSTARGPAAAPEAPAAPGVEPASGTGSGPDLPPPYVPPPPSSPEEPGVPAEPASPAEPKTPEAPEKPEKPAEPAAPAKVDPARPGPEAGPDPEERARRERVRRAREAEEELLRFEETLADRIARYSFAGPVADLEAILDRAPEGRVRDRIEVRLADLRRARGAFESVQELLAAGDGRKVTLASGLTLRVTGADEEGFTATSGPASLKYRWVQLDPSTVRSILAEEAREADDWLVLSAFGAVFGLDAELWEEDLLRAYRRDEAAKPEIDAALAVRRGVDIPPGGFVLYEGEWVTPEDREYLEKGYVRHEGRWLTHDEYMKALGYVKHEGRWLSPDDYEKVLEAQREAEELAAKFMPKGLIDEPGHGDAKPWGEGKPLELKTPHYKIRTNLSREVAQDIAYTMEILITNFKAIFGLRSAGAKFTVNVVANRQEYTSSWRAAGGSLGFTSSGEICTYYQPPMTSSVLMHEGTHQILHKFAPSCPRWLHEGMASYFECSRFKFDADRRRVELEVGLLNAMRLAGIQQQIRTDRAVSLETFMKGAGGDPYQQGWAFVYYLAKAKDGQYAPRLHTFVQEAHNRDVVERFQKIFKVRDLDAFEAEWREYILSLNPADGIRIDSPHK